MDKNNKLLDRLRAGQTLLSVGICYPAAGIIECMCKGWDVVWIDGQHGQFSYDAAMAAVRTAAAAGVGSLLRVPSHDAGLLGVWADMAPDAVMIPMVNTAAQAQAVAEALHYPPRGDRSFGGRRPNDLLGRGHAAEVEPLTVAQIETPQAVQNTGEIIRTEGIDMLFFSADDLKLRMGLAIDTPPLEHPKLRDAMEHTVRAAAEAGKFAGVIATSGQAAAACREMGYQFLVGGADALFLHAAASQRLQELRQALSDASGADAH